MFRRLSLVAAHFSLLQSGGFQIGHLLGLMPPACLCSKCLHPSGSVAAAVAESGACWGGKKEREKKINGEKKRGKKLRGRETCFPIR